MREPITTLLLLGMFLPFAIFGQIAPPNTPADASSVQMKFLGRLRDVALAGQLFDTKATAATLGLELEQSTQEVQLPLLNCRDGTKITGHTTTVSVRGDSWFRPLPSGAGHIAVPAFTINRATVSGDPKFDYKIFHTLQCAESRRIRDYTEAQLSFGGLPAFTCLTPSIIQAELSGARLVRATDGVFLLELQGQLGDESGTTLTFQFRAGASCALSAEVKQDQQDGLRYRRALYRYSKCREPLDKDFCSTHRNITWADTETVERMDVQADQRCGTVDFLYRQETRTGLVPPPLERRVGKGPCDGR